MATKVIDKNEARLPFFGDKMSFITGLDPLGLQNPSAEAYSYLLPGLNNVTSRIRNYSFYCWLLSEYAKRIKSADPKEQKRFIRKAEYIIALVAVKGGIQGISGSLYASKRFSEDSETFDLNKGTYNPDGSTENTYWQYGFGVFGQYYVGSLRQIGLIEEPVNESGEHMGIYRRTPKQDRLKVSGEELALAFDENITPSNKDIFFRSLEHGSIDHEQLQQLLNDFDLTRFEPGSNERALLLKLLLDVDEPPISMEEPECMRKETLIHVLRYVDKHDSPVDPRVFAIYAYDAKGYLDITDDACLNGWYYYQLNEYWQVACTAIFNGLLDSLEEQKGPRWMPLHELIVNASNAIVAFLVEKSIVENSSLSIASVTEKDHGPEIGLYNGLKKEQGIGRMAYGFVLIWSLFQQNKDHLERLKDYTGKRGIGGNNDVLSFYLQYPKYLRNTIDQFMENFLLNKIIHRHQYVAYRKMGGGSQSTQKFIIEENYIRKIGNFEPGFTGPRIGNLIAYLQDLNLLDEEKKLTGSGERVLIEHS